jgi:hypothetical protein
MSLDTAPIAGLGITLGYNLGGSSSYTPLVELMDDCEFGGFDTTVIPIKTLSQTYVTKVPGRIDSGEFTGSTYLVLGNAGVLELINLGAARTTCAWQIQLPDGSSPTSGSTAVFSGFVSNVKPGNFTGEDAPTLDFTISISGAVTIVAGS